LKNRSELLAALADLHDLGYEGFETNFASLADSFADPLPARAEIALRGLPLDRTPHFYSGAGEFDFAELGRVLAETDWAGWLIVEVNRNPQIPSAKWRK